MNRSILLIAMSGFLAGCEFAGDKPDGSGTIECTQVQVSPEVAGRIAKLPPQEGTALKKGDPVAQLDPTDYELKRDESRATAKIAEADLRRIQQVFDNKSATQKQMDDAPASYELTKTRLAIAEKAVADCAVKAPMSGVVTIRNREEGEFVGIGTPLITLSRLDEVWLSVYIPADRLGQVKFGQTARVKIDGDKTMYNGTVTFVSPEAEFTPRNVQTPDERAKLVYRVKITLPNPEGIFKPGMPADGFLETR
jgi:HlyD family secretion protein